MVSLLHEFLLKSPSLVIDGGNLAQAHTCLSLHVHSHHGRSLLLPPLNYQVLTGSLVFGKLFAFVAFIFVYKILITSFIV